MTNPFITNRCYVIDPCKVLGLVKFDNRVFNVRVNILRVFHFNIITIIPLSPCTIAEHRCKYAWLTSLDHIPSRGATFVEILEKPVFNTGLNWASFRSYCYGLTVIVSLSFAICLTRYGYLLKIVQWCPIKMRIFH